MCDDVAFSQALDMSRTHVKLADMAKKPKPRRLWEITGWDSTEEVYRCTIPVSEISEGNVRLLLQLLAAKHGLSEQEIVLSMRNKRAKRRADLLDVLPSRNDQMLSTSYTCGICPYFTARVVEEPVAMEPPTVSE